MTGTAFSGTKITARAYGALAEALAVIWWNKAPFELYLRMVLRPHPEVLARLDFAQKQRSVAASAVRLLAEDQRYVQTALKMMTDLTDTRDLADLAIQAGAQQLLVRARIAAVELRAAAECYRAFIRQGRCIHIRTIAGQAEAAASRSRRRALDGIRAEMKALDGSSDRQQRGRRFEVVIYDLLDAHDMEPRTAYNVDYEQIDGSFMFNTDHFILEAKWCRAPIERAEADIFAAKVQRKGRNTLGLYVSISGFTQGFIDVPHANGCPFIALDGDDLRLVLDGQIGLEEVLRLKRRHLNDTGRCYLAIRSLLN